MQREISTWTAYRLTDVCGVSDMAKSAMMMRSSFFIAYLKSSGFHHGCLDMVDV